MGPGFGSRPARHRGPTDQEKTGCRRPGVSPHPSGSVCPASLPGLGLLGAGLFSGGASLRHHRKLRKIPERAGAKRVPRSGGPHVQDLNRVWCDIKPCICPSQEPFPESRESASDSTPVGPAPILSGSSPLPIHSQPEERPYTGSRPRPRIRGPFQKNLRRV